jgi:predicted ester cyclase
MTAIDARTPLFALVALVLGCYHPAPPVSAPLVLQTYQLFFEQALGHEDTLALAAAVAPEFVFHARGDSARIPRSDLLRLVGPIRRGFPDIQFHVQSVVSTGDTSAVRLIFTGTHRGMWQGIAPTGRRVTVTETFFCRSEAARLAECWQEWDEYGLRQQLTSAR